LELWKGIVASAALALKHRCEKNLFLKRYAELDIRESLFSDTVGALGHLQKTLFQTEKVNSWVRSSRALMDSR
jgi:hypothetical protein